jgi:CheY-like chemotaxis protein
MAWRVLVADDDPEICTLIKTILGRGDYDVTSCSDAESALVHIGKDEPYDLLISDFMLPGISGIDLITQLRQTCDGAHADRDDQRAQQLRDGRAREIGGGERVSQQAVHRRAAAHDRPRADA